MIGHTCRTGKVVRAVRMQASARRARNNNPPGWTESLPQAGARSRPGLHMHYTLPRRVDLRKHNVMRVNMTAALDGRVPWAWENLAHAGTDVETRPARRLSKKTSGDASVNSLFVAPGLPAASDKCTGCSAGARIAQVGVERVGHAHSHSSTWRMPYFGNYPDGEHGADEHVERSVRRTSCL